jgi:hypothetical protein
MNIRGHVQCNQVIVIPSAAAEVRFEKKGMVISIKDEPAIKGLSF